MLELETSMMVHDVEGPVPAPPPVLAEPPLDLPKPVAVPPAVPIPMPAVAEPVLAVPMPAPGFAAPATPHQLVAPAAAAAAAMSVGALMRTLASERSTAVHRGGPTIEDLVRDEVRPLLKEWLDQHLPPIVERLVRAEIERVVSRTA